MLAGGDLDGDLYNIIFDKRFVLSHNEPAAEYPFVQPLDLGRPVEATDVAKFFIDFIDNNLVGLISSRHLLIADQEPEGVYHSKALKCAELQSIIVDFPKTGIKVSKSDLPRASRAKPDFLAPGPRLLISKDKVIHQPELENDEDEDTVVMSWYPSDKILGHLYRAINETEFLDDIRQRLDYSSTTGRRRPGNLLGRIWAYMLRQTEQLRPHTHWEQHVGWAVGCRERYEELLKYYMSAYSDTPWNSSLTEAEVFVGTIVGREKQTRRQRELSGVMKQDFDDLVTFVIAELRGEDGVDTVDRCLACLHICLQGESELRSFAWVAVSVLMAEVDVLQKKAEAEAKAERLRAEKAERMEKARLEKAAKAERAAVARRGLVKDMEQLTI